jgi:hypothetical protein
MRQRWLGDGRPPINAYDNPPRRIDATGLFILSTARPRSQRRPVAFCLEPHDLVLAKRAANRDRDWDFARAALAAAIVEGGELVRRARLLPLEAERLEAVRTTLVGVVGSVSPRTRGP